MYLIRAFSYTQRNSGVGRECVCVGGGGGRGDEIYWKKHLTVFGDVPKFHLPQIWLSCTGKHISRSLAPRL